VKHSHIDTAPDPVQQSSNTGYFEIRAMSELSGGLTGDERMSRILAWTALGGVAAMIGATASFVFFAAEDTYAGCHGIVMPGDGVIGGPFALISETGAVVTDKQVIDMPSLIYFGYTYCPDVCPLDVVRNAEAVDVLDEWGIGVKPVFISVDYGRDTAESVDDFTANIHPAMLGLTGTQEQVRAVAKAYRYVFSIQDPEDEFYLISHMTLSYLMDPEKGFVAAFDRSLSGEQLADQVACYLGEA
jgi:protein SCO1/2